MAETTISDARVTVRLVGGPYDQQLVTVAGLSQHWEIVGAPMQLCRPHEMEQWVPAYRHVYRLDPQWRKVAGQEPPPFVYADVVRQETDDSP